MSILLFEDFTKLYKRWKGGEVRKEDEFHSNIEYLKPVDLGKDFPVLFADVDLQVDGNNKFMWEDVILMIDEIKKTGWRLPNYNEMHKMFYNRNREEPKNNVTIDWQPEKYGAVTSKETGKTLYFPTDTTYGVAYWMSTYFLNDFKIVKGLHICNPKLNGGVLIRVNDFDSHLKTRSAKIRLVKDKYK